MVLVNPAGVPTYGQNEHLKSMLLTLMLLIAACGSDAQSPAQNTPVPPTPTFTPEQLIGRPVKGSGPSVYRVMETGELRHLLDWATFLAWGYQPGEIDPTDRSRARCVSAGRAAHALGHGRKRSHALFSAARPALSAQRCGAVGDHGRQRAGDHHPAGRSVTDICAGDSTARRAEVTSISRSRRRRLSR